MTRLNRSTLAVLVLMTLLAAFLRGAPAAAQNVARRSLEAVRLTGPEPVIDGRLNEAVWATAAVADHFIQFRPHPGAPATERTVARVLYASDALYVGIRAYDDHPDSIIAQLTRRDGDSPSDKVGVLIDSGLDRRTAYQFTVNPRGVKTDVRWYDDTEEDSGWDPVWDVATREDSLGWTAEFRIPYTQLRFPEAKVQTWGIEFHRDLGRRDELSLWAPILPRDGATVSRFGDLRDLRDLRRPANVEYLPYAMSRVQEGADPSDPTRRRTVSEVGADAKIGVTGDMTLDLTVNPDFGQVEADPAQVNLTAFETFYPERRPFFQEANNLFDMQISLSDGDSDLETLFYSRRVGRQPHGLTAGDARFSAPVGQTTILGAAKLSGRTSGGWSVGLLNALTAREYGNELGSDGTLSRVAVEPRTDYSVLRVIRDFREGRTAVGIIGTGVFRETGVARSLNLDRSALAGGVDVRNRFAGDRWLVRGRVVGSRVAGSQASIASVQRSPLHYFQRPDAQVMTLDTTRTSLVGTDLYASLHRVAGGPWRGGVGYHERTAGFEVSDAGFQRDGEQRTAYAELGYERHSPQGPFRSWQLYTTHWLARSHDGTRITQGGNVRGEMQLSNLWGGDAGVEYDRGGISPTLLRGGPGFRTEKEVFGWFGGHGSGRRALTGYLGGSWSTRPESRSWSWSVRPTVQWRPTASVGITVGPFYSRVEEDRQWLGSTGGASPDYLFGRLAQRTAGLTARADLAFSPTLTLQVYAQPFVSAGAYEGFKKVADPLAARYADRFTALDAHRLADGRVSVDVDGNGVAEAYDDPDFNYRQLRATAVLRWEYRPGSTLYMVWSQGRSDLASDPSFRPFRDLGDLLDSRSDDVFMLKISYWMSR